MDGNPREGEMNIEVIKNVHGKISKAFKKIRMDDKDFDKVFENILKKLDGAE